MINISDKSKCSGCHSCASICPKNCIEMVVDNEDLLYPQIDTSKCVNCGLCEKSCPIITRKEINKTENDISAFAAYTKNEEIRLNSSSGGLFTEIATYVINNGGAVFGAAFNEDFSVSHQSATTVEELAKFRGSKYVQSTIGNTYNEVKSILKEGKLVLFTGTPCQIGGLYSYLNKDYDNLITQDIICHGAPSPMVWKKYKEYQENKNGSKLQSVQFRNKDTGWKTYSVVFSFENGSKCMQKSENDMYIRSFISNLCLRPSCYDCSFKTAIRQSDITLADFWGIENVIPEMDNDKGNSLLLINSQKGKALFEKIKDNITYKEADLNEALKYNSAATQSVQKPQNRDLFISTIKKEGFEKIQDKFFKKTMLTKIKIKIKNFIKRILN